MASRIRCTSPAERVLVFLSSVMYSSPTEVMNPSRFPISLRICPAIISSLSDKFRFSRNNWASSTDILVISVMDFPSIVTARLSGFNRFPPQAGQGIELMNFSISDRIASDVVSLYRLSKLVITPSNCPVYITEVPSCSNTKGISSSVP